MLYKPEVCVWETTYRCNVNCIHCGSDCTELTRENELNTIEAISMMEQLADLGCNHVTLSGGEPLLRKDWPVIAHKIKQLGMDLLFISNGYIINPETVATIARLRPRSFGISIDGGTADLHDYIRGKKGCFDRALNAIDMLLDAGVNTVVVTSLQRINFNHLPLIRDILLLKGVDAWQIQVATPQGRMDMRMAVTERQYYEAAKFIVETGRRYKRFYVSGADCFGYYGSLHAALHPSDWNGCHAGLRAVGVESNGNIKGCLSLPGEKFIEGNIKDKPLAEIWNKPDGFLYNRHFTKDLLTGYCAECFYGTFCRGGCTERSYGFTKSYCENTLCLHKIEQDGYSSEEQASLNPNIKETVEMYNSISELPESLRYYE